MFQGLQLPEALNNLDFNIIIHQSCNIVKRKNIVFSKKSYYNKQKSQEMFSCLGLQSSEAINNLDFNIILHQSCNIVKGKNEDFFRKYSKKEPLRLISIYFNPIIF